MTIHAARATFPTRSALTGGTETGTAATNTDSPAPAIAAVGCADAATGHGLSRSVAGVNAGCVTTRTISWAAISPETTKNRPARPKSKRGGCFAPCDWRCGQLSLAGKSTPGGLVTDAFDSK